ncbi:hypothetical protein BASA61_004153 [Batrachochytrium salamandrivorans]|nr:hypothetical protein BASA61_004153 [Batrachochytrium salamandrivorans]
MTDEQFNLDLARIFNKMRDSHTLFYKSGPYGCFSVSTGLFFKSVDDSLVSSTPPKVRVVGITSILEVLDLIRKALSPISVGDELLTVNGLSFDEFILGFGANDSGGHSGAFKYLAGISGSSNILPEADSITFQLKRLKKNQAVYTVTIPYVALSNDECWIFPKSLVKQLKDTDAILFDIRGNDGGSISGADGIIQLFKSDVTASQFRYLKNEVTRDIFYKGLSSKNPWSKAWDATSDTSRYSGLVSLYDSSI